MNRENIFEKCVEKDVTNGFFETRYKTLLTNNWSWLQQQYFKNQEDFKTSNHWQQRSLRRSLGQPPSPSFFGLSNCSIKIKAGVPLNPIR